MCDYDFGRVANDHSELNYNRFNNVPTGVHTPGRGTVVSASTLENTLN